MASKSNITPHDNEVLKQIFSYQGLSYDDVLEGAKVNVESTESEEPIEDDAIKQSKALEIQAVKAAESGDIDSALDLFSQAIAVSPSWPSSYNNRAQARRLKGDEIGAMEDLDKAIELSRGKGSVACQAFTQRGLLRKKDGDDEGSKKDLEKAAKLGSGFAKQMLVAMNPYAALCNQMMGEVMQRMRTGEEESH